MSREPKTATFTDQGGGCLPKSTFNIQHSPPKAPAELNAFIALVRLSGGVVRPSGRAALSRKQQLARDHDEDCRSINLKEINTLAAKYLAADNALQVTTNAAEYAGLQFPAKP